MNHVSDCETRSAITTSAASDSAAIRLSLLWIAAVLAVFMTARSLALAPGSDRQLIIAGLGMPLPELCSFRNLAGLDCPGCGLTRSFVFASRFQLGQAWAMHPVGVLLAVYLAGTIPLRLWHVHCLLRQRPVRPTWRPEVAIAAALVIAMYIRWIAAQLDSRL